MGDLQYGHYDSFSTVMVLGLLFGELTTCSGGSVFLFTKRVNRIQPYQAKQTSTHKQLYSADGTAQTAYVRQSPHDGSAWGPLQIHLIYHVSLPLSNRLQSRSSVRSDVDSNSTLFD